MEIRTEQILVLHSYQDKIANITFIKVLTAYSCESVKITKDKQGLLNQILQPHILSEVELIKTAKNWILRGINKSMPLLSPSHYSDFEKLAKLQSILHRSISEGQQTDLLPFLVNYLLKTDLKSLAIEQFETEILKQLGFINFQNQNPDQMRSALKQAKRDNHM